MAIRNIKIVRAEDMSDKDRKDLDISANNGLVAIETHNSSYQKKAVAIGEGGILDYLWSLKNKEIKESE